jgi:manganese/zinc/iron transport system substrate-binding protein
MKEYKFLCGDANKDSVDLADRKIRVTATIGQLRDAAEVIGGDRVEVIGLMGAGVDPHLYRATAGDIKRLEDADLILYCGLELEGRMGEIFEAMDQRNIPTAAAAEDIDPNRLRKPPEFNGKYDPHIWFDASLWKLACEAIRDELVALDPGSESIYNANFDAYAEQLDELDQEAKDAIASLPENQRVLVTAHDAFGYFGRRYGMEIEAIQGVSTVAEATPANIKRLADLIADRKVKAIFVESSVPPSTITALQKAVQDRGWNVQVGEELFSDAMGDRGTVEDTYMGMFQHNLTAIVDALK